MQTRKLIQRASGVLARAHEISQPDALQLLVRHARTKRCSLLRIAEAAILLDRDPVPDRFVLRQFDHVQRVAKDFFLSADEIGG